MFIQNYSRGKKATRGGSNEPPRNVAMAELKRRPSFQRADIRSRGRYAAMSCWVGVLLVIGGCALDATEPTKSGSPDASRADQRSTSEQRSPRHSDRRHLVRVVLSLPSGERGTFAEVTLRIVRNADAILEMSAPGDELWIGLKPGRYGMLATFRGIQSITREVIVPGLGSRDVYIQWRD